MSPAPMPADKETGRDRQWPFFAAIRDGFEPHHIDSDQSVVAERLTDMLRKMRSNGNDEIASGWRIVPVIVTIEDKANDR